jgi:hypothetical protein
MYRLMYILKYKRATQPRCHVFIAGTIKILGNNFTEDVKFQAHSINRSTLLRFWRNSLGKDYFLLIKILNMYQKSNITDANSCNAAPTYWPV